MKTRIVTFILALIAAMGLMACAKNTQNAAVASDNTPILCETVTEIYI